MHAAVRKMLSANLCIKSIPKSTFCYLSSMEVLSEEELVTSRIDFDSVVQKSMPKIFARNTTAAIMKGLRIQLCRRFESLRVFFTSFNELVPISLNDPINAHSLAKRDKGEGNNYRDNKCFCFSLKLCVLFDIRWAAFLLQFTCTARSHVGRCPRDPCGNEFLIFR